MWVRCSLRQNLIKKGVSVSRSCALTILRKKENQGSMKSFKSVLASCILQFVFKCTVSKCAHKYIDGNSIIIILCTKSQFMHMVPQKKKSDQISISKPILVGLASGNPEWDPLSVRWRKHCLKLSEHRQDWRLTISGYHLMGSRSSCLAEMRRRRRRRRSLWWSCRSTRDSYATL